MARDRKEYMRDYMARRRGTLMRRHTAPKPDHARNTSGQELNERERTAIEMAERKPRPRPESRPWADDSPALAALRRSLRTARGAERARIARLIEYTEGLYRPPGYVAPQAPRKPVHEPPPDPVPTAEPRPRLNAAQTYSGPPCVHCKGTLRYAVSRECVTCSRKRGRDAYANRKRAA
jgi:hypothetical protein